MVGIGGLIGDANGKKCNQRRNQIEAGVGGFRKIPRDWVASPTTIFSDVITSAASTEFPATARFRAASSPS